ncbi:MAG: alkylmercury lyase family protein [Thaumarchaeota archaeon]|nr:alkylmercury lyase family protein [Nitrososphaerota archaeon]
MEKGEIQRHVRKYVFDYFLENTRAPVLEEVMQKFQVSREAAFSLLKELEASHHLLLLPGTQRILIANPFSSITTPFKDYIDGRTYFANCAWDTISMHVMIGRDTEVESFCHHCSEPIKIRLSEELVVASDPKDPLIFLSVPVSKWYDNLINTCSNNMVYFSSEAHLNWWLAAHPDLKGEAVTVPKMLQICQPLSRRRMELDFERPSTAVLMAHWESIGLRGDFWKF